MSLNRSLQKLAKEIDRLRARIAELESAGRILRELEGGQLAEQKVRQLGKKMMTQPNPDLPIRPKRKISKPIVSANGKTYRRMPREIWQGQTLTFLQQHPGSTTREIAAALNVGLHGVTKRISQLMADKLVTRTGTGAVAGSKMHRYSVR
jgi:hypothetical protein